MNELVSDLVFRWFLTLMTGVVAGTWFVYDAFNLWRTRRGDRRDPVIRDKLFGFLIGIVIGSIGVLGCLRYQHVL